MARRTSSLGGLSFFAAENDGALVIPVSPAGRESDLIAVDAPPPHDFLFYPAIDGAARHDRAPRGDANAAQRSLDALRFASDAGSFCRLLNPA